MRWSKSGRTTAMLFVILTGALMFAEFVNYTTMPNDLKTLVSTLNLSPIMVITAICVIYVLLGTAMEELSMILLTVPVFFPLVVHLGFDPIWFGILVIVVVEIGLISPPVGMNLFVLKALLPEVPTSTLFRGRAAVRGRRRDPARHPDRVSGDLAVVTQYDALTPGVFFAFIRIAKSLRLLVDAFSWREPVPTLLENALSPQRHPSAGATCLRIASITCAL